MMHAGALIQRQNILKNEIIIKKDKNLRFFGFINGQLFLSLFLSLINLI